MDEQTDKLIQDQFIALPKVIQDAILHSGWEKKIHTLSQKYALHIDQEGAFQNETFLVMLGIEPANSYADNLVENLGVSKVIAAQLVAEANAEILKPILAELQKINEEAEKETEEVLPEIDSQEEKQEDHTLLDRDSILKEIENPEPLVHPETVVPVKVAEPKAPIVEVSGLPMVETTTPPVFSAFTAPQPITAPVSPVPPVKPSTIVTTMPKSENMVSDRLKDLVKTKTTEVSVNYTKEPVNPIPPQIPSDGYKADPYREPIN